MSNQTTDLSWRTTELGLVPVSTRFDDPYYSLDNGLAETDYVFLAGNDLPARFATRLATGLDDRFQIAELGFGTGLNFLATLALWRANPTGHLSFTSFEAFPLSASEARDALAAFPSLAPLTTMLLANWDAAHQAPTMITPTVALHVVTGDARAMLPEWNGMADAWFLDGFSPAKNPELWDPALLACVGAHTAQDGTIATYTAAGHVRRALMDAGFAIRRMPGFGRKRHMTTGRKTAAPNQPKCPDDNAG